MSLQLRKPICRGPGWISPIKRCAQARAFVTFGRFPQACICAPFFRWFKARTYKGLHTKHFLGLNNARKCPCARPFIPQASHLAYQNTCLSNTCVLFVLLTLNVLRSFYSAEYEILMVFWQWYQTTGVIPFLGHDVFCWNCPTVTDTSVTRCRRPDKKMPQHRYIYITMQEYNVQWKIHLF